MPEDCVVRFLYPVSLVWEVEEFAFDAETLEGVEGGEALSVDDPVIERAVYDEHRGPEVFYEVYGVVLFVALGVVPWRSEVVPFGEPELLGVEVCESFVEVTGVVYEAFEPVGPVSRNPVNHVAAERGAERNDVVGVHPGVSSEGGGETFLEVLEGFATPVTADRVAELLAVTNGAVEVDHDGGVAF